MTTDLEQAQQADLLEAAADVLEANGWVRNLLGLSHYKTGEMSYCAFGALNMADHNNYDYQYRRVERQRVLDAGDAVERYHKISSLVSYNNVVAKDKYEIIEMFRSTAKDLRNEA